MPQFLNVDFEFTADEDLSGSIKALEPAVFILANEWHNEAYYACVEMNDHTGSDSITAKITEFFALLDSLSPAQSEILYRAKKVIDIGYSSNTSDKVINSIEPAILAQIARRDFVLVITVYPSSNNSN